jgi:NAD(P)H-hydrate epimerase
MEKYIPGKKCIVMTRDQVRAFDDWAINRLGIPGVVLMENAGRNCTELIFERLADVEKPRISIFCGTGNNGGDGYVIARHLLNRRFDVTVIVCGDKAKIKGDARANLNVVERLSRDVVQLRPSRTTTNTIIEYCRGRHMLVDALFGTGLEGELRSDYQQLVGTINAQEIPTLSVDIPSGLDCDTGQVLGQAIKALYTVTFVAVKKGFTVSDEVLKYTGDIYVASIGIDTSFQSTKAPGLVD